ncbi:tetratricopeptide repeat protein [Planctomicrobium sp. SH664]|uniref:tetratricopeptide repeat protein n=1 Tax=Planctomicrobium sp. SH664 TaxID=3448125 RepID=UPI003F5B63F4
MKRTFLAVTLSCAVAGCGQAGDHVDAQASAPVKAFEQPAAGPTPAAAAQPVPTVPYEELLTASDKLLQSGQPNDAVKQLTLAIQQAPQRAEAYVRRAAILGEARFLPAAINDLSAAIQLDQENPKLLNTRGYFLMLLKHYPQADADFTQAISLDLAYAQPYNNRGLVAIALGNHKAAVRDFETALRINPEYVDAHNNLGFAQIQLGEAEAAVQSFDKALSIDPKYINAITNRARANLKLNRPAEAAADLTKAIALQPQQLPHYVLRAEAYEASGQEQAAQADLDHINWVTTYGELTQRLQKSPGNADLWTSLGEHLLLKNRDDEAVKAFEQALKANPKSLPALMGQARLAMRSGQLDLVISACTQAIEAGEIHEARSLRGDAHVQQGNLDAAIEDYVAAKRFDSGVIAAYRQRAEQRRTNGQVAEAQKDEELALTMQQSLTDASKPKSPAPRAMVVEQASFEEPAAEAAQR